MNALLGLADSIAGMFPFLKEGIFASQLIDSTLGQYLLCIAFILFFSMLGKIVVYLFKKYMRGLALKTENEFDDLVMEVLSAPMFWVFVISGFYMGLHFLELSEIYSEGINAVFFTIMAGVAAWILIRLVDGIVVHFLAPLAAKTKSDLDDQLLPVIRNTLKASIIVIIFVVVLSHYGIDVTAVLTGLGIGGLALAFAAKETIADIFGGISIFTSRPFKVGDWVSVAGISGTVKEVGLRHTRIRALDKRLITIPNSKVASSIIENISKAPKKMTEVTIGLTYNTSVKDMAKAVKILREAINERDDCEKDPLILFKKFDSSSVNIVLRYWIEKKAQFNEIRSEVNFEIKKRFDKAKLDFAFPTQTVYLEK